MPVVISADHKEDAALVRRLLAVYARSEDLVRIGAYKPGTDADLDRAMASRNAIRGFLEQDAAENVTFSGARQQLRKLTESI